MARDSFSERGDPCQVGEVTGTAKCAGEVTWRRQGSEQSEVKEDFSERVDGDWSKKKIISQHNQKEKEKPNEPPASRPASPLSIRPITYYPGKTREGKRKESLVTSLRSKS
jgi:hypothetical protein